MKSWCKVASNLDSHPRVRRAGRNGREVFLFALRRNAEPDNPVPGRVPAVMLEPWYLADQLMMPEAEAVTGVTGAVTSGLLFQDGDSWVIVGWEGDWGKKPIEGKDRTAKWREKQKPKSEVTDVTSRNVTESHRDESDALDQRREEEKRLEEKKSASKTRASQLPDLWAPARSETNLTVEAEAKSRGVDLRVELMKLRDWAKAKGATGKDWDARWRNWLRSARGTANSNTGGVSQALLDMAMGDS